MEVLNYLKAEKICMQTNWVIGAKSELNRFTAQWDTPGLNRNAPKVAAAQYPVGFHKNTRCQYSPSGINSEHNFK